MPNSPHHGAQHISVRAHSPSRSADPTFPSCPLSSRPAQLDRPGASPSWEELLGQR